MKEIHLSKNIKDTRETIGRHVLEETVKGGVNVILLQGDLGAGKTTFAQGILGLLGAEGPYTSPTFVIMKVYQLSSSKRKVKSEKLKFKSVYHIDAYRVGAEDVLELGWEEIIADPQNLVLVEWPEKIKEILSEDVIKLNFNIVDENRRKILISKK